jgi:hypothetical protein
MATVVLENDEFLIEDSEGVGFIVLGNRGYQLSRRLTEKRTNRVFYVDRNSLRVFEHRDGTLQEVTDRSTLQRLDAQRK